MITAETFADGKLYPDPEPKTPSSTISMAASLPIVRPGNGSAPVNVIFPEPGAPQFIVPMRRFGELLDVDPVGTGLVMKRPMILSLFGQSSSGGPIVADTAPLETAGGAANRAADWTSPPCGASTFAVAPKSCV